MISINNVKYHKQLYQLVRPFFADIISMYDSKALTSGSNRSLRSLGQAKPAR